MKKLKILVLSFDKYPHIGGKSTHIYYLASGLKQIGHDAEVVSFSNIHKIIQLFFIRGPGYVLRKVPCWGKTLSLFYTTFAIELILKQYLNNNIDLCNYDIVSAQDIFASNLAFKIRVNNRYKYMIIATVHGDRTNEAISSRSINKGSYSEKLLYRLETEGYIHADHIIAVDNRLKQHAVELLKCNDITRDISVMYNFLDTSVFRAPTQIEVNESRIVLLNRISKYANKTNDPFIILCPRRLTAKNGVIYAAQMMQLLVGNDKCSNIILVYAGDGEERGNIEKLIQEHKLEAHVILLGDVDYQFVLNLYWAANLVVIPSVPSNGVIEATSLSALEAMASCVPVIASSIGGLAELITNEETGILVPPGDAFALAQAVMLLKDNSSMVNNIIDKARRRVVTNHSHIAAAHRLYELYTHDN